MKKMKKIKNIKKYIILFVVLCCVYKILATRIIDIRAKRTCPLVASSETVSAKELDVFLRQWAKYIKHGYLQKVPENFWTDEVNMADRLPWVVRFWMAESCIDPQRFYYTEQRVRSILKACQLKKHTDGVVAILSMQITDDMDENKKQWYENLIEKQNTLPKIEGVTDEEIELVKSREEEIKALFK